jgi:hypothetical protein
MSGIYVHGIGAISPAGWGMEALRWALEAGTPLPTKTLARPGWDKPLTVRRVLPPGKRLEFLSHARLRRASPISYFVVGAALEAVGGDASLIANGTLRAGIVSCVMNGCVNYSRRFYDEVLREPTIASPLVFPETVFNAPASHLAALLGTPAINYTVVGDPGGFLQGLAVAAQWLAEGRVDACVVVGAEETDWLTSEANHIFSRRSALSEGAGAVYLKGNRGPGALAELRSVTDAHLFLRSQDRAKAAELARAQLPPCTADQLLADSRQGLTRQDAAETAAWSDWTAARISPKIILGEGLTAGAAWQCAVAVDAFQRKRYAAASVSVVGCNQQAIGAHFVGLN